MWFIAALYVPYQFLLQGSPSVMIADLMKAFSINVVDIGLLSSSFFYSYILLQVPSGILVDRYGVRKLLSITIFICALSCLLFAISPNFYIAQISRFFMGIVASTSVVSALYLASNWFSTARFGLLTGLMEMLGMLGGAIGQSSLAKGVAIFGWRPTMMLCTIVGLLLAIAVWFIVRDNAAEKSAHVISTPSVGVFYQLAMVLKNPQLWINGMYSGLMFAMISGFAGLWCVPYLTVSYGLTLTAAANYTAIIFIGAAAGGPILGWLAGMFGYYRGLMLGCAGGAFSLALAIINISHLSPCWLAATLLLLGFCCGSYTISFLMAKEHVSTDIQCAAMGFTNMLCILVGAPIIQPLIGFLLKAQMLTPTSQSSATHYQYALNSLVFCLALAIISVLFMHRAKPDK